MGCSKQTLFFIAVALMVGIIIGNLNNSPFPQTMKQKEKGQSHIHKSNMPHTHTHSHNQREVSKGTPIPSVDLIVHDDPKAGWNLQLVTQNIELTPHQVGSGHIDGQGHIHIYIDGEKLTRIYGQWYHVPKDWLTPGDHEISVTLSANDHSEYTVNGEIISDKEMIRNE